jgi:hypothetical protein
VAGGVGRVPGNGHPYPISVCLAAEIHPIFYYRISHLSNEINSPTIDPAIAPNSGSVFRVQNNDILSACASCDSPG